MAYTSQTFSFEGVLTAAEMNQQQTNITEVRRNHKGSSAPAETEAGVMWLYDGAGSPWPMRIYTAAGSYMQLFKLDTTIGPLYETGDITVAYDNEIQYLTGSGTSRALIGMNVTGHNTYIELPHAGFTFRTISDGAIFTLVGADTTTIVSGQAGQILATAGTVDRPTYSFLDDPSVGMHFENHRLSFAASGQNMMMITDGSVAIGKSTVTSLGDPGVLFSNYQVFMTADVNSSTPVLEINRLATDGELIRFYKDSSKVGDISVSGGSVSLNCHIGRQSQLPGLRRRSVAPGTLMTTNSEPFGRYFVHEAGMKRWAPEAISAFNPASGHQVETTPFLARSSVSNVEADPAVYGVFDHWAGDGDWDRDFSVATTGDFVVRVTGPCRAGDLLESAGDGTARVQADDIVRASTIGRVMIGVSQARPEEEHLVAAQLMLG